MEKKIPNPYSFGFDRFNTSAPNGGLRYAGS
jgi:hypothetical protein